LTALVFFVVFQAFDKVCHAGKLFNLKTPTYSIPFNSKIVSEIPQLLGVCGLHCIPFLTRINGCVLQGAVMASLQMFNLLISDQSKSNHTLIDDFANEKAIIATSADPNLVSLSFQDHLHVFGTW